MAKSLEAYRKRRDFSTTPEPSGAERSVEPSDHLRFVVQKHDATRLHYDLRLELDGVFKSWAVTRGPSLDPGEKRLAVEVEDHPLEYGDFEGTIPEDEYGGGTVMIWDRGFWAPETDEPPERALARGELKFILAGSKLKGGFVLVRLKPRPGEKRINWLLIKHRDQWATPGRDDVLSADRSAASTRTMAAISAGRGKPPTLFMTRGEASGPAAVWNESETKRSRRRLAAARTEAGPDRRVEPPRLTTPDRVLWSEPPTSKADLARYLVAVAPWMIDHVYGRPCSLLRAPDGIAAATFFQRHAAPGLPAGARATETDPGHEPYIRIDDAQTIADMAQISVIEFHPWGSAPFEPHIPGRLVFDLDPGPGVAFDDVVAAAREVRDRLAATGLAAFCKTTGGKGLHVVVPLVPDVETSWDQAKLFANTLAAQMARDSPARFVTTQSKQARRGRIYVDYLRNDYTATAVAPLSPRARPGATVSMPLDWPQVRKGLDPARFTLRTAPALLARSKPWSDYADAARPLQAAIARLVGATP